MDMYGELIPDSFRAQNPNHTPPTIADVRDHFIGSVFTFSDEGEAVAVANPIPGNRTTSFYYNAGPLDAGGATSIRDVVRGYTNSMDDLLEAMRSARPVNMGQLQHYFTNVINIAALKVGRPDLVLPRSIAYWQEIPTSSPFNTFARDFAQVSYNHGTLQPDDPTQVGPFFGRLRDGLLSEGLEVEAEAVRNAAASYWENIEQPYRQGQGIDTPSGASGASSALATLTGDTALPDSYGVQRTAGQWLTRPGEKFYKKPVFWIGTSAGVLLAIVLLRRK